MKHLLWTSILPLCLLLVGCNKSSAAPEGAAAEATSVADTEIAVAADYEEKAESEITADNYKKELEQLENEIKK